MAPAGTSFGWTFAVRVVAVPFVVVFQSLRTGTAFAFVGGLGQDDLGGSHFVTRISFVATVGLVTT